MIAGPNRGFVLGEVIFSLIVFAGLGSAFGLPVTEYLIQVTAQAQVSPPRGSGNPVHRQRRQRGALQIHPDHEHHPAGARAGPAKLRGPHGNLWRRKLDQLHQLDSDRNHHQRHRQRFLSRPQCWNFHPPVLSRGATLIREIRRGNFSQSIQPWPAGIQRGGRRLAEVGSSQSPCGSCRTPNLRSSSTSTGSSPRMPSRRRNSRRSHQ